MSVESITRKIEGEFELEHDVIEYVGDHNTKRIFGLVNKNVITTIEQPFYLSVDREVIEYVYMPMLMDDSYTGSPFAVLEEKFKFFEKRSLIE